jgi:CubicO group peptidase (beta-lactamase class C family)
MRATRIRAAVSLLVLLTSTSVLSGGQGPLLPPGGVFPVLETYLESMRQQARIPGMSAAVLRDEQIVWERGFGFQNVETRVRATPDTPYLVGNVTSTLAAVLLLKCVEERRLDLDEPLGRYGLTQPETDATLRQVLSHASPGTKEFAYSPERFSQLTVVMEWCAPQPFRKSVAHRILNHLAMRDSVPGVDLKDPDLALPDGLFAPEDLQRYRGVLDRMALPYRVVSRNRVEQTKIPAMSPTASNGLVSTVRDLARFDQALDAGSSGGLLLDETLDLAWTPATGPAGNIFPTGLGWFVQSYKGERVVWQFGYIPNAYSSLVLKVPARHLTFILLANSDGLSAPFHLETGELTRSLFATLFLRLVK